MVFDQFKFVSRAPTNLELVKLTQGRNGWPDFVARVKVRRGYQTYNLLLTGVFEFPMNGGKADSVSFYPKSELEIRRHKLDKRELKDLLLEEEEV